MRVIVRTCDRLQAVLNGTFTADEGDDDAVVSLVKVQTPTSQRRKKALLWTKRVVLALVIIAALSAGGYYGWQVWKHHQRTKEKKRLKKTKKTLQIRQMHHRMLMTVERIYYLCPKKAHAN